MHHRISLSSVSEAAINRTPARFKQRDLDSYHQLPHKLNIALKVAALGEKKFYLCCVVPYEPLQVSAG